EGEDGDTVSGPEDKQTAGAEPVAGDVDLAGDEIDGALVIIGIERQDRAGREHGLSVETVMREARRGALVIKRAENQPHPLALAIDEGKIGAGGMGEGRLGFLMALRQGHPALDPVERLTRPPRLLRRTF